uniref:Ribonuclease Z n=1 Tax=Izziella formosana TaxID=1653389 RepID=A0A1G4NUF2_9FLOR|nr:Ribonuclease Z [Izziella formosana]SCW22280.1 Ribonuclease Z [Izziella formosana]
MLNISSAFLIRCSQTGEVWLFNCPEGCQQELNKSKISINHITHIVLADLKVETISGLVGLLSSLSLNDRVRSINLYGPPGLLSYINLARKYSKTSFRYNLTLYIHTSTHVYKSDSFRLYCHPLDQSQQKVKYIFLEKERPGRFQASRANKFGIIAGPVYGYLKMHRRYILPDGTMIEGKYFTNTYSQGNKISFSSNQYGFRINYELQNCSKQYITKV